MTAARGPRGPSVHERQDHTGLAHACGRGGLRWGAGIWTRVAWALSLDSEVWMAAEDSEQGGGKGKDREGGGAGKMSVLLSEAPAEAPGWGREAPQPGSAPGNGGCPGTRPLCPLEQAQAQAQAEARLAP